MTTTQASDSWRAKESQFYVHVVNRQPLVIARGKGARVWDADGKEYLDFVGGWAVTNLGHTHPDVTKAIAEQAATLIQTSNQFFTIPQVQLAELIVKHSVGAKVFFANSGTEANEGATKVARKYGRAHRDGAYEIITVLNSFHGRTLAMVAATGQPRYQERWQPLMPGFKHVEYGDLAAIERATDAKTAAVMIEVVQGEAGVIVPPEGYLKGLREWCDRHDLLLIFDEIQTGMGRLGTLWGYESVGVEPDVFTLAKGLGNGVPIGAFVVNGRCDVLEPGDHGSTFGGNALATAAGHATLRYMTDHDVPGNARRVGAYFKGRLEDLRRRRPGLVKDVRGVGLLLAVQFNDAISGKVVAACNAGGLLLNAPRPDTIRFMPPLIITEADVDECMTKLGRGIDAALGQ
ncbi:MAG: aspartate aminotransferase family protein [SAR202 cluster bacterium]|nr:aspartate aminotransferase family protein [SAR202 cluster bacterium]